MHQLEIHRNCQQKLIFCHNFHLVNSINFRQMPAFERYFLQEHQEHIKVHYTKLYESIIIAIMRDSRTYEPNRKAARA